MRAPRRPRRPEHGGILLKLLWLLLLVLVLGTLYRVRAPLLRAVGEWWVVDEELEKAQAILVLGGDSLPGDRVRHAARLYRQGLAPKVLMSGPPLRADFSEGELMQKDALAAGIPAADLLVVRHQATSTLEEALALRPALAEHNFTKLIIVTSNFHTRRARRIFRTVYKEQGIELRVSAAPDARFDPARWWQDRIARATLTLEMLKTVYTWFELWSLPAEAPRAQAGLPAPAPAPPASIYLPAGTAL